MIGKYKADGYVSGGVLGVYGCICGCGCLFYVIAIHIQSAERTELIPKFENNRKSCKLYISSAKIFPL